MVRSLFERHLTAVVERYPNLNVIGKPGQLYLRGILDIPDGCGGVAYSYMIEIKNSALYPYRYPIAYEVGGDIPIGADSHKYGDNHLCLTVEADEIIQCRNGMVVVDFIEKVLIPHLANQYYRHLTGAYLQEYAHGLAGIRQYYGILLKTKDTFIWSLLYRAAFVKQPGRNETCCCGSAQKYKRCHESAVEALKLIGKEQVGKDFRELKLL